MLDAVLPRQELLARFGGRLILDEYHLRDMARIVQIYPSAVFNIGASVWNRIVTKGWNPVDPQAMAAHFRAGNPRLPIAIGRLIGSPVIHDIYYVKGWDGERVDDRLVVELMVARVHRNDLQLADVTFIDPTRPLGELERRSEHQTHRGLGLLPSLFDNMDVVAREAGCECLTLTSTTASNVDLFRRHGFEVEDSAVGRLAMEVGAGIPMERALQ